MLNAVAVLAFLAAGGPADEPQGPPAPAVDRNGFSLPPGAVARLGDPDRRHRVISDWVVFSDDDRLLVRPVDGLVTIFDLDRRHDVSPGYLKDYPHAVLRILPDGRHLLYTPATKRCEVRDPNTGRVATGFDIPNSYSTVDITPPSTDGKRVLVKYRDSNGYSCAVVADLTDDPPSVKAYRGSSSNDVWVLSANGKRLFQGWERGVAAYDAAGGDRLAFAASRYRTIYPFVPTADGSKVIAGWDRGTVALELTADGFSEPAATNMEANEDFAFAPDGKTMVRAGVGVYDAKGSLTPVEPAHDRGSLRLMRYSRTASRCVDLFYDRPPVVWDPHTGKTVYRFEQEYAAGTGMSMAADGTVSLRYADRTVRTFALDGKPIAERTGRTTAKTPLLGISPDGTTSVEYEAKDRKVFSYDIATGIGTAWPQEFPSSPHTVRFDSTGRRVYVAGNNYAGVFDVGTGRRVRSAEMSGAAAFSDDGRALAVVGKKDLRVYELASGKERVTAEMPATDFDTQDDNRFSRARWGDDDDGAVIPRGQVQFSADGGKVAVFWVGGRVTLFDTTDGGLRFRESRLWNAARVAALRPDGEWFATTTRTSRRIALRSTTDPRADRNAVILADCKSSVIAMAFTPDGKRLVSAHDDGTALVWDVEAAIKIPPAADPEPGDALWVGLASSDAKQAGRAVNGLIARPDVAVPLLAEMTRPVMPPPAERVKAAVVNLGDREFKVREAAEKQLRVWGELAADELSAAEPTAGAEQGERIRRLLDLLEAEETDSERLRLLRAVEVLERIGTPSAKVVLEKLGTGAAASVVTREAKEALKRLKDHGR